MYIEEETKKIIFYHSHSKNCLLLFDSSPKDALWNPKRFLFHCYIEKITMFSVEDPQFIFYLSHNPYPIHSQTRFPLILSDLLQLRNPKLNSLKILFLSPNYSFPIRQVCLLLFVCFAPLKRKNI